MQCGPITLKTIIAIISAVVGSVLLTLLYPRIKKWGLLWSDIMEREDLVTPKLPRVYAAVALIGIVGGLVIGLALSLGLATRQCLQQASPQAVPVISE